MEGYYWRFADREAGWAVAAICGVCRAPGGTWALVSLAAEPGGLERSAVVERAWADPEGLGVTAGRALRADADGVAVDLGPDARLRARFRMPRTWPRRAFGALGPAHVLPGLGQYWTPHLLGAEVEGTVTLGGRELDLSRAAVYGEKNWGEAFAAHWWWGQADLGGGAGVAFAGGRLRRAGVTIAPTAVAVWTPERVVALAPPVARTAAAAGGGAWRVRARSARWEVELSGRARSTPLRLLVPVVRERRAERRAEHHLAGRLAVTVRHRGRAWLEGGSEVAALEDGRPAG